MGLFKPIWKTAKFDDVKRITSLKQLRQIAVKASDWQICMAALAKINDQEVLKEIALNGATDVRAAAILRISDQDFLKNCAMHDNDPYIRLQAAEVIDDESFWAKLVFHDMDKSVHIVAITKTNDRETLKAVLEQTHDPAIQLLIYEKLGEKNAVACLKAEQIVAAGFNWASSRQFCNIIAEITDLDKLFFFAEPLAANCYVYDIFDLLAKRQIQKLSSLVISKVLARTNLTLRDMLILLERIDKLGWYGSWAQYFAAENLHNICKEETNNVGKQYYKELHLILELLYRERPDLRAAIMSYDGQKIFKGSERFVADDGAVYGWDSPPRYIYITKISDNEIRVTYEEVS